MPLDPKFAKDIHSQFGEDGYISEIFRRIGTTNKWCFEVGAHDGRWLSNTLQWREQGWNAVLAEEGERNFKTLVKEFGDSAICVHETVTDLDNLLTRACAPADIDLGVIDIDGQDYWLWHDMKTYRPRVLMIEFNPHTDQGLTYWGDEPVPRGGVGQTGEGPILELGQQKGYTLAARTHVNLIFARNDLTQAANL